jgi:hypothetical protein
MIGDVTEVDGGKNCLGSAKIVDEPSKLVSVLVLLRRLLEFIDGCCCM